VTTLAGVPHTFELLDRVGFSPRWTSRTCAPSRRPAAGWTPHRVVELATLGRQRGFDLFVMYGQTEATARMAYLPPDLAAEHPTTVGVAVPGGSPRDRRRRGRLLRAERHARLRRHAPSDLALGRTVERLHTGDLGRITDAGLLEITGRRSRVAKVLGHRVDLDHVERTLRSRAGHDVRCLAGPDAVTLAVAPSATAGTTSG
jgi:acyl-coenzyme A synthetase/AMP-(fatty) acid ligase